MKHIVGIENIKENNLAITIGKFDALHKGHRLLIEKINSQNHLKSCVIIFSTSPRMFFSKEKSLDFVITKNERKAMFNDLGVDILLELPFNEEFANTAPEDFIKLLFNKAGMKYICVGEDYRFGSKGLGDAKLIKELSNDIGFDCDIVPKVKYKDSFISSTRVRDDISNGNIKSANEMLGYDYFVEGKVVSGNKIGTDIGFPTINVLPPDDKLIPLKGVYKTRISIEGKSYNCMTNIGNRPTIKEEVKRTYIETHVLNADISLNTDVLRVSFLDYIREEKKFDSIESLRMQLKKDFDKINGE